MMKNPSSDKVQPVYIEPRVLVSPFKLPETVADYPTGENPQ